MDNYNHSIFGKILIISALVIFLPVNGMCVKGPDKGILEHDGEFAKHRSYLSVPMSFREYKNGNIIYKTNNFGFREDANTKVYKDEGVIRILVTGDSHIDSIVINNESFPSLLEDKLNSAAKKKRFEVINAACGFYAFDNYYAAIRRYLFLNPEVFIVVVYIGNDFMGAAEVLERRGKVNKRPPEYKKLSSLFKKGWTWPAIWQAVNQIYYFKTFPAMKEEAVRHALKTILEISAFCKKYDIEFIVVFLPTKLDVEWQEDKVALEKIAKHLELTDEDMKINRDLTESLIKGLKEGQINFLDLYDDMKGREFELYWKTDYHLNAKGHELLAEEVYKKYRNFLSQIKRKPDQLPWQTSGNKPK